jgi:hypothetical protein
VAVGAQWQRLSHIRIGCRDINATKSKRGLGDRVGCNLLVPNANLDYIGQKVFAFGKQIVLNGGFVVPQQYYNLGPPNYNPLTLYLMPAITQVGRQNLRRVGKTLSRLA